MDTALSAVLYGLGGALGWGASNFFAAQATRDKSAAVTVFNSQLFLFLAMVLVAFVLRPDVAVTPGIVGFAALNYLVFTVGLLVSYRAYAIGPISITSPIVGANALIVVAVSVLVFGEVLAANQWLGIVLLFLGLAAVTYEKSKRAVSIKSSGVSLAFMALVLIGAGLAGFVYLVGQVGWEATLLLGYFFPAFWAGLYLALRRQMKVLRLTKSMIGLVAFQLLGTISVSVGVERSLAAVVVPVSAVSPMVTSVMGLVLFREAIARYKLAGVALIIAALVLIAI